MNAPSLCCDGSAKGSHEGRQLLNALYYENSKLKRKGKRIYVLLCELSYIKLSTVTSAFASAFAIPLFTELIFRF